MTAVRLLAGLHGMALPFYVIYATQEAGVPAAAIGGYLTAQTVGMALSGLVLGPIADRWGSQRAIQIATLMYFLAPLLAVGLATGARFNLRLWAFPAIFLLAGVFEGSIMLGFLNFVLEIAPADSRPTYMGLTNTVAGLLVAMPLIGGWLLQRTSYLTIFVIAVLGTAGAAALAFSLPNPRRRPILLDEAAGALAPAPKTG